MYWYDNCRVFQLLCQTRLTHVYSCVFGFFLYQSETAGVIPCLLLWEQSSLICLTVYVLRLQISLISTAEIMIGMTFESVLHRLLLSDSPLDKGFNSFRSRRSDIFSEIDVLKHFAIFAWKHLCWSLFLINFQALRPATLLKRDSNKAVFLWILRNF